MPEGPELHLSSRFVKKVGEAWQFVGKILERLPSNRSPKLDDLNSRLGASSRYTVTSWSRGKELMIAIKPLDVSESKKYRPEEWSIRFNFGMTGCFKFTRTSELPKHAKVCFTAAGEPACTLSFVDMRGFGRWTPTSKWSENRGPCILQEHQLFRKHVLNSLEASAFNKPICEVMLDQRYFNGVGNYLRAEALHRLGVAPFSRARDLLSLLSVESEPGGTDLLQMCHRLAADVVSLGGGRRYDVPLDMLNELTPGGLKRETDVKEESQEEQDEEDAFENWLQCYYQPGMKNLVDHQGRTVWFAGDPGPLVPKARKQRHGTSSKKSKSPSRALVVAEESDSDVNYTPSGKLVKRTPGRLNSAARSKLPSSELKDTGVKNKRSVSSKTTLKKRSVKSDEKAASVRNGELKNKKESGWRRKTSAKKPAPLVKPILPVNPTSAKQLSAGERRSRRLSRKCQDI